MKKGIVILVGVLCLAAGAFGGIKVYEHIKSTNAEEKVKFDKEKLKSELDAYFHNFGGCDAGAALDFSRKDKLYYSDLDNNTVYNILYSYMVTNKLVKETKLNSEISSYELSFSAETLEKALVNVFGKDVKDNFKLPKSIDASLWLFKLDESNKIYKAETYPTGCEPGIKAYYLYNYDLKDDKKFFLDFAYYYSDMMSDEKGDDVSTYDGAFDTNNIEKFICKVEDIKNHLDKFTKYRYNFKLEDDHFIFDYIEKID